MSNDLNSNVREEQRSRPFNPNEHLTQIKTREGARDYLPVQWRLVWFREQYPHGSIETEMLHLDIDRETEEETFGWNSETRRSERITKRANGFVVFRATVKDGEGGVASGTKSEKAASFPDYIEKAETGAIGRALAALGFGTQFAPELNEEHRIVDAPVERHERQVSQASTQSAPTNVSGQKPAVTSRAINSSGNGNGNGGQYGKLAGVNNKSRSAQAVKDVPADAPATESQMSSIRKLCNYLDKPEPRQDSLTYAAAAELISQLSQEYKQSQQHKAS
ncbi:MAG TPA: hypothetical protein VFN23_13115 [Ktedonobacteraceae bacterium]|nr:hypothetical protein [Ktedonobacteraceae bacterium]